MIPFRKSLNGKILFSRHCTWNRRLHGHAMVKAVYNQFSEELYAFVVDQCGKENMLELSTRNRAVS